MTLLITLLLVFIFDIVALKWGFDSRDDVNSAEWKRRLHVGRAL